jgi:hypothetical protein
MADQDDPAAERLDEAGEVGGVDADADAAQQVRRRHHVEPGRLELAMTPFQPEASTKAPWTSTTVGVKPAGVVSGVFMRISSPVKWNRLGIVRPACHPAAQNEQW